MNPSAQRVAQLFVSSHRLAARWLAAAGTSADIASNLQPFESAKRDFEAAIAYGHQAGWPGDHLGVLRRANVPWVQLMDRGFSIAEGILSTRSIPPRDAKGMELAYRLCSTSRRMPKDVYKWWATNQKRIELISEAAHTWPEKQEGTDELFTLGGFRVHNTVGATGPELESLKNAIERVERLAKKNPVPGFARVVYGDLHVVARLSKAHNAAWYRPGDDSLYLRRSRHTGIDEVQAMLHELGHRYWAKFASKSAQREWYTRHVRVGRVSVEDVKLPGVGDTLPIKIRGTSELPVVKGRERGQYVFERPDKTIGYISSRKIFDYFSDEARTLKFPTPYSSTSEQEHFCEALSLLAMGTLADEHAIPFNAIWNS